LSAGERETLQAWFDAHGVDHRHVPIDPRMVKAGDVLHVEVFATRDGRKYVAEDGETAMRWVSFTPRTPPPWPGLTLPFPPPPVLGELDRA
jgi:hypothetical protein